MYTKYPSRFNIDSPWKRLLFRGGKKSQAAEFQEMQQLINNEQGKSFYSIYGPYTITEGLKVEVKSLSPTYSVKVKDGRIFVRTSVGSYFIDIKSFTISLPVNSRSIVSVKPKFLVDGDTNLVLRDPVSGGFFAGSKGAHRLVVDYDITVNEDGYPLFILDGQGSLNFPYIYYYVDNYFTTQYRDYIVPPGIRSRLELYTYEEYGDYIVEGLDCRVSNNSYLSISPGIAYINGKKVVVGYGFNYPLPDKSRVDFDTVISLFLSDKGLFELVTSNTFNIKNIPSTFKLVDVHVDGSENNKYYKPTCTNNRALNNNELLIITDLVKNTKDLLLIQQLRRQEINDSYVNDINISGTLVESFSNTTGSSVFHPLYDSVIEDGALRMGYSKNPFRLSNLSVAETNRASITSTQNSIYISPTYVEIPLINQTRSSEFVVIRNTATPSVRIIPSYSIPSQSNLRVETVNVRASGFRANEDNINLTFGNVGIFSFNVSEGTTIGTSAYSVKAANDGTVSLSFSIPSNMEAKSYPITLSNARVSASAVYSFAASSFTLNNLNSINYNLPVSALAQTFYVSNPVTITSIELAIRTFNELLSNRNEVFTVSLVKSSQTSPSGEVITRASVAASSIITSGNGSKFTKIIFDTPGILPTVGYYAILISTSIPGLELFTASVNVRDLKGGPISDAQPLTNGNLLLNSNGTWQSITNSDLTFKLNSAVVASTNSSLDLVISNLVDQISDISLSLVGRSSNLSYSDFRLKVGNNFITLASARELGFSSNSLIGRIEFNSSSYLLPYIDANASYIETYSNNSNATWISKNYIYGTGYTSVEITADYYSPNGSEISILISSNKGQTWEGLTRIGNKTDLIVDGNIPLYRNKFRVTNLSQVVQIRDVNGVTNSYLRKEISVRIDMETRSESISPYVTQFTLKLY